MSQAHRSPSRRGRGWRLILPLFLLAEVIVIVGVFQLLGWWTVPLLLALSALGLAIIGSSARRSWRDIHRMRRTGVAPERSAGDAAFSVLAGALLVFPGVLSSIVGLLLLAPVTRTWVRRLAGVATSRGILRMMGVRVHHGAGGNLHGDVVPGDVVSSQPGSTAPGASADSVERPQLLEGTIIDRDTPRS